MVLTGESFLKALVERPFTAANYALFDSETCARPE